MTRSSRALAAALLVAALFAPPSAATAAVAPPAQPQVLDELVLASSEGTIAGTEDAQVYVNQLQRSASGITVLAWTLVNRGEERLNLGDYAIYGHSYRYAGVPYSGVTLLDHERQVRHHPLMDSESQCVCSGGILGNPPEFAAAIGANRYTTYYATYLVPEEVEALTVEIVGFAAMEEVPVSS